MIMIDDVYDADDKYDAYDKYDDYRFWLYKR
jgi:hypothetical protein